MRTTSTLSGGDFLLTARYQGIFQSQPFLLHAAEQSLQATYSESHRKFQRVTRFYRSQDQSLQRIVSVWRPTPLLWALLPPWSVYQYPWTGFNRNRPLGASINSKKDPTSGRLFQSHSRG